jgi:hypothetical protein
MRTWLADLLAHGLIRGSFVPDQQTQEMRDPGLRRGRLVWAIPCQAVFPPRLVAAVAARRVDCLQLFEIELGDGLQLVGQSRSFEVFRQVVEPAAVFVL